MPIPASASGVTKEDRTPTTAKSMLPATRRQRQPRSHLIPSGTASWRQTMDSSSAVRVIEKKEVGATQGGTGASGATLHTAKRSGRTMIGS